MDPLSIAGLALACFDELLVLGTRTAELISDIRSFDEDFNDAYQQIRHEMWKTERLKGFLFTGSSVLTPLSFYATYLEHVKQADIDFQRIDQIHVSLLDLKTVLAGAVALLDHFSTAIPPSSSTAKTPPISPNSSKNSTLDVVPHTHVIRGKANRSPLNLLKWSLRDKSKAAAIISHFADLNSRLLEKVQFLSLASSIGVEFGHLERLQVDDDSIKLGFKEDAALKLTIANPLAVLDSFELQPSWQPVLEGALPVEDRFAYFEWSGKNMLQENCVYTMGQNAELDPQTRNKVNALVKLLNQPKEKLFCTLQCEGWSYLPQLGRIAYIFQFPEDAQSLGIKFRLAYSLARSIAQFHMVKWVHESLRSENILFFIEEATGEQRQVDLSNPLIFGFEYSRPDAFFSAGFVDIAPNRDVYRHPERQGQPLTTFSKIHDIYALGVVLLEIGLWRPVQTLEKNQFKFAKGAAISNHLMRHAQQHIETPMGEKYKNIILKCLSGSFGVVDDNKEDLKLQQAFRLQVVDVLRRMVENV